MGLEQAGAPGSAPSELCTCERHLPTPLPVRPPLQVLGIKATIKGGKCPKIKPECETLVSMGASWRRLPLLQLLETTQPASSAAAKPASCPGVVIACPLRPPRSPAGQEQRWRPVEPRPLLPAQPGPRLLPGGVAALVERNVAWRPRAALVPPGLRSKGRQALS